MLLVWGQFTVCAHSEQIPLFVFAGQSNMTGYATNFSLLDSGQQAPQNRVFYAGQPYVGDFNHTGPQNPVNWGTMVGPTEVHTPPFPINSGQGFGPELSAPLTISNAIGNANVGAVKFAVNASGFGSDLPPSLDWTASSNLLYGHLMNRVNASIGSFSAFSPGNTAQVSALFWMQGERDADDENRADVYQYNLTKLINQFRTDVGNANLPVVIGRIGTGQGPATDAVRRAQENIARLLPNVALVDTDDLPRASGFVVAEEHYNTPGTWELGVRFGKAFVDLSAVKPARPESFNKVVNGSFEDYAISNSTGLPGGQTVGGYGPALVPADAMPGWTATGAGVTLSRTVGQASSGQQWIALANDRYGNGNGGVTQSFNATGQTLTVLFDYSALSNGVDAEFGFTFDRNGAGTQTFTVNTLSIPANQMAPWVTHAFTFTDTGNQTIRFLPTDNPPDDDLFYGAAIDNVMVVEGSVWKLAGSGDWGVATPGNWHGPNPEGTSAKANFLNTITAPATVSLANSRTAASLRFDSVHGYTLSGPGPRTMTLETPNNAPANVSILVGSGSHTIASPVSLEIRRSLDIDIAPGATLTISANIIPNVAGHALNKFGGGSLILSNGNNTYSGPTRVVDGTLRLQHASDTNNIQSSSSIVVYRGATLDVTGQGAAGAISLSSNQVLGGSGTVRGGVNATNSGSGIAPGTSAGALTFTGPGNITLGTNAVLSFELGGLNNTTQVAGYNFDQIIIDGSGKTFTTGGARLSLSKLPFMFLGQTYRIIEARNGATINFSALFRNLAQTLQEGQQYSEGNLAYTINYYSQFIDITIVPEPGSALLLLTAPFAALSRRHARRRR
jgi:autotransporter-associated beta strand protein